MLWKSSEVVFSESINTFPFKDKSRIHMQHIHFKFTHHFSFVLVPGMHGADLLNAWKYEDIYDSAKVRGTEGFHSPFSEFAEPRNFYVDSRKLSLEEELGESLEVLLIVFHMTVF